VLRASIRILRTGNHWAMRMDGKRGEAYSAKVKDLLTSLATDDKEMAGRWDHGVVLAEQ